MNELELLLCEQTELDLLVQILVLLGWGDAAYVYARLLSREPVNEEYVDYVNNVLIPSLENAQE